MAPRILVAGVAPLALVACSSESTPPPPTETTTAPSTADTESAAPPTCSTLDTTLVRSTLDEPSLAPQDVVADEQGTSACAWATGEVTVNATNLPVGTWLRLAGTTSGGAPAEGIELTREELAAKVKALGDSPTATQGCQLWTQVATDAGATTQPEGHSVLLTEAETATDPASAATCRSGRLLIVTVEGGENVGAKQAGQLVGEMAAEPATGSSSSSTSR